MAIPLFGANAASGDTKAPPVPVPASVRSLIEEGSTILGYAETHQLTSGAKHMAVVTRRRGRPGDYLYDWDFEYTCELIAIRGDAESARITGRSQSVVDCSIGTNLNAGPRDLDGALAFEGNELVFSNEDIIMKSGTMTMKFRYVDGRWLLRSARSLDGYRTGDHELTLWESLITSPKHVGFVALDDLEPYELMPAMNTVSRKSTTRIE